MPVTVPMDPATSPGDYPAEVQVAGVRRAALLRVDAELAMRLTPRRLLAEPGTHNISFVAINEGNVDVPLAPVTRGRTSDGGKEPGPDVTLTLREPVVVAAASTLTVHGRLKVPPSLEPTRRHTAFRPSRSGRPRSHHPRPHCRNRGKVMSPTRTAPDLLTSSQDRLDRRHAAVVGPVTDSL